MYLKVLHVWIKWASSMAMHKSKFTLDCQAGFGCPSLSKNDSGVERTMSYCAWAILPMTVRYCAKVGDSQPYSLKSFQYQNDSGEQYSGHFPCNCARELKHRLFPRASWLHFLPPRTALMAAPSVGHPGVLN